MKHPLFWGRLAICHRTDHRTLPHDPRDSPQQDPRLALNFVYILARVGAV